MTVFKTKQCDYCNTTFEYNSKFPQKFCQEECRRRAKQKRNGKNVLAEETKSCVCGSEFTPKKSNQQFCSISCRGVIYSEEKNKNRNKFCSVCKKSFYDDSIKNTRKSHLECILKIEKQFVNSKLTEKRRNSRVRSGVGGRIDQLETIKKDSETWWGQVAERIFQSYDKTSQNLNQQYGNNSPVDLLSGKYGYVEVRGSRLNVSKDGKKRWLFKTELFKDCQHLFCVGFSKEKNQVQHLWFFPSSEVPSRSITLSPTSDEYQRGKFEVSSTWGLEVANRILKECLEMEEIDRPTNPLEWVSDKKNFQGMNSAHLGRRAEFLYQEKYPDSIDMNTKKGLHCKYDFTDQSGLKVNVKSSRKKVKIGRTTYVWSFSRSSFSMDKDQHGCDLYSCLCLDVEGKKILREYRIPVSDWGIHRKALNINEDGTKWEKFRVPTKDSEISQISKEDWNLLSEEDQKEKINVAFNILKKTSFPYANLHVNWEFEYKKLVQEKTFLDSEGFIRPSSPLGNPICSPFFPNRYKAISVGKSAFEMWHTEKDLKKAIQFQFSCGDPVVPHRVLRAITMRARTPSLFRPLVAKYIYENYAKKGTWVYDPCMGYGGRLLAACASGVFYMATDVEKETLQGNLLLAEKIGFENIDLQLCEAQDFTTERKVSLVFTSPPYFEAEKYSQNENQSYKKFSTFEAWKEGFLRVLVRKARGMLMKDGFLIINIADVKRKNRIYELEKSLCDICIEEGFSLKEILKMPIAKLNRNRGYEPVFVFC